jgi:1,4-alpha-glucan branching enzyme
MLYSFTENFLLPFSHDEVVHGKGSLLDKMPGDAWKRFANLRALYGLMYTFPGKKLLFMGCEFAQGKEWDSSTSLDWHLLDTDWHQGVQHYVRDLNRLYTSEKALHEIDFRWEGFEWLDFKDWEKSVVAYVRRGKRPEDEIVVLLNFTPETWDGYRIGVPGAGYYREIFNSDSEYYGGSNKGNAGGLPTSAIETHGHPQSLELTVPPLSVVLLKRDN